MYQYEAKFAREAKPDPHNWAIRIKANTRGAPGPFELVYLGDTRAPKLANVKRA